MADPETLSDSYLPPERRWRTADELRFVRQLGTHCARHTMVSHAQQLQALRAYRRAAIDRVRWGAIDRLEVLRAVDGLIAQLTGLQVH